MVDQLAIAVTVASLLVAVWAFVAVRRDRPAGRSHLAGLAVVELLMLVQAAVAIVRMAGGERPGSVPVFVGYLAAALLVPPGAGALAVLERTKWGAVVVAAGALVMAVLMLRLQQVWRG
ncbi:MAG TPA: hypothetical protein VFE14_11790 [Micromonosporaceae bacterium]|jgi:hypothetical protein|nr:hypothetical protein [Micromonosporaceae bacterium]